MNLKLTLFLSLITLSFLGLIIVFSVAPHQFHSQLTLFLLGFVFFVFFAHQSYHIYLNLGPISYLFSILFLILPLIFGSHIKGASRWLTFASFHFQPSEITKPFLIISYSYFLTHYPPTNFKNILKNTALIILPALLVFFQPDLGTTILYLLIGFGMLFVAGLPLIYLFIALFCVLIFTIFLPHILKPYQLQRLAVFLSPASDPLGAGYNVIQSMLAVGSGYIWGRGIRGGIQSQLRFLPEHYTDFIFASYSEEFGFIGSLFLVLSFLLLLYTLFIIALRQSSLQNKLIIFGILLYLFTQSFLNIAMNIGLAPVTGITLPFISVGGSSLIATFISFGIVFSFFSH